jgi:hypothetical protein
VTPIVYCMYNTSEVERLNQGLMLYIEKRKLLKLPNTTAFWKILLTSSKCAQTPRAQSLGAHLTPLSVWMPIGQTPSPNTQLHIWLFHPKYT